MVVEKFVMIIVEMLIVTYLSYRYIKKHASENLIIVSLMCIVFGSYISFTLNNVNIPIYFEICVLLFAFIVPITAIILQYNNIMIMKKILYYRMKYAYFSKEYQKTINIIIKIIAKEGRNSEYLYILGMCYKNLNDYTNAADSFALAIELNKEHYNSYFELGIILDETNKKESAIMMFKKALKIKPDFYEAREALGICLTSQGKFKEAVKVYRKNLEKYPNSYEMYYNIAILELELGNYEASRAAFKRAGEIKPDLYTAFYNLGNVNYMLGEYDAAIEAYKKILISSVYGSKGYYKIAMVYASKKEYAKSMASLEYAIELEPKYIRCAKEEYEFENMQAMINKYLIDKEVLKNKEKQKRNYMFDKFRVFKMDSIGDEDYSRNYATSSINQYDSVKHA